MKRRKHEFGIKWRLFLYFLVFSLISVSLIWIVQVLFTDSIYKAVKVKDIMSTASELCEKLESEDFKEYAEKTAREKQLCLYAFAVNKDNTYAVASVDILSNCAIHRISSLSVMRLYYGAKQNGGNDIQTFTYDEVSGTYFSNKGNLFEKSAGAVGNESIIYTTVTSISEDYDVVIMLNAVISPQGSTIKAVNLQLLFVSVLLVIISLIIAFILARHVSLPIIRLNNSAKLLADGKYDVNFDAHGYREISELSNTLNNAERELADVDRMKSDLIANISHDLRTPLTMINGYAEIMRDIPGENTEENIQVIIDESKRLTTLINDVLSISRLEGGAEPTKPSEFCLTESLSKMIKQYTTLLGREEYHIRFDYDEKINVYQDESKLLEATYNLVNNAVTYTGDDKCVTIVQKREGDRIRIEVSDTGKGISPEKLPYIWDRYYKVDTEHKRNSVGSGLGLSIVRTVMQMLGGKCGVITSDKGSTFWIEFSERLKEDNRA